MTFDELLRFLQHRLQRLLDELEAEIVYASEDHIARMSEVEQEERLAVPYAVEVGCELALSRSKLTDTGHRDMSRWESQLGLTSKVVKVRTCMVYETRTPANIAYAAGFERCAMAG